MDAWRYEIYFSSVEQDISFVRFAHFWDILVNTRYKFYISANPCIILCMNLSNSLKTHEENSKEVNI